MKKEKRLIYIEAATGKEFEEKMNEALKGLPDPDIQIYGKFEGAIIYTEHIFEEEEKSIAEMFEEAGCGATCSECPYYTKPTDGRVKWTVCNGRKVKGSSKACDSYYLGRRRNVPETGREDEGTGLEDRGYGGLTEDLTLESLPQTERRHSVLTAGAGDLIQIFEGPGRGVIRGGERCLTRS